MKQASGRGEGQASGDEIATGVPSVGDLARLADDLLQQVGTLRRHHEDLRDKLAAAVAEQASSDGDGTPGDLEGSQDNIRVMALRMALIGDSREAAKEELRRFNVEGTDEIVDDVFDRTEEQRAPHPRVRLFARGNRGN
jgi:hypothetical protein